MNIPECLPPPSFWMTENRFRSHFSPFQINAQFLFFFTKWLPAAILDDRKSLSIAFLAKLWASHWAGQNIKVQCDNMCSVMVINHSQGTTRNLTTQIRTYLTYCIYSGIPYLPISEKDLARYITFLTSSFKSATSVLNYVNGVRFYHVSNHLAFTHLSSHNISLLLKGVTKRLSSKPHQKLPITPAILHAIHNALDFTNCTHISFWAACLTGFFGFLRKSNLVTPSVPTFDPARHISRSSFSFLSDGSVLLTLHWSKTIQHNQRLLQLPYHPIPGSPLCPVKAVTRMIHTIYPSTAFKPRLPGSCTLWRSDANTHTVRSYAPIFPPSSVIPSCHL